MATPAPASVPALVSAPDCCCGTHQNFRCRCPHTRKFSRDSYLFPCNANPRLRAPADIETGSIYMYPTLYRGKYVVSVFLAFAIKYGACIFGAHYNPIDAEFTLCESNNCLSICLLDFGMFEKIDMDDNISDVFSNILYNEDCDMYIPENELLVPFRNGMKRSAQHFINVYSDNREKTFYSELLDKLYNE